MTITSPHNEKLKEIRKLRSRRRERERAGRFVAEGEDLLAAADLAGWPALERYCARGSGLTGTEVDAAALASVAALASGTRALAVYEERWAPGPAGPVCLYLHGIADPGNIGTLLRSADAFRVASVVLGPGCADPFAPKAVRASMGSIFSVPLARGGPDQLPGTTVALVAAGGEPLRDVASELAGAELTLLIGAERHGLPDDVVASADHVATIPIATHSLNAAMAATVALYEVTRMAG